LLGLGWSFLILVMAFVDPRWCGAMIGPVFLFNYWAHRVQFADVHEMLKKRP
jgi:hypothetical protein